MGAYAPGIRRGDPKRIKSAVEVCTCNHFPMGFYCQLVQVLLPSLEITFMM